MANLHQANLGFHDFLDSAGAVSTRFGGRSNSCQAYLARAGFVCPKEAWSEQAALQRLQISNDGRRCGKTIARGRAFEPSDWPGRQSLDRAANHAERKI